MMQVRVSSKYQIVIPKEARRQIPLHMGQTLSVVVKEGVIALLPNRPLATLRGFLKGMNTDASREKRERL